MPYNTRRKSLSLPSLGIHVPVASRAHRSNSKSHPLTDSPPPPPSKRVKRSHEDNEPPSPLSSPVSKVASPESLVADQSPKSRRVAAEHTPPPSPGDVVTIPKVDTDGINDDIVIDVIQQLEKTGNRPHLIKELSTVLAGSNDSVAHSANPAALLSSRLSLYLKRPWTALSPCPLAKELIPVHPRKVFFYLTTGPRQPLPDSSDDIIAPTIQEIKRLTPSVSDPSIDEEDMDMDARERCRMSPSPEIDLSSPELDHGLPAGPPTPGESFSGRSSVNPDGTMDHQRHPTRAPSPPLEADEKGFTETATAVRARGMSLHEPAAQPSIELSEEHTRQAELPETPEVQHRRDQALGYELFGQSHSGLGIPAQDMLQSSPMIHPKQDFQPSVALTKLSLAVDVEMSEAPWSWMSPEAIEVDELDGLFTDF